MPIERKLAAIMFTDIAGYTEQMSKSESKSLDTLEKKRSILTPLLDKYKGTFVKEIGDGTLSYFESAVNAATCAVKLQEFTYDDKEMNIRVGIHIGDIVFKDGDVFGGGVNVASRLESIAPAGGVCVSKSVYDELSNQDEFDGIELGLQSLKGVGRLIEVFGLKGDKLSEPNPNEYQDNKIDKHSDEEVPSIAIIPFDNKGADEDVFYAYGISVDLISDVSSAGLIRVASKKQIDEAGELPQKELAKKLDVRYMANGELWRMGDMFQLSVELYDTKNKKVVWSDRWQEKWDNLPTIKGSLSDGLLKALDTKPKVEQKVDTTNPEAYEFYLKAQHKNEKRENTDDTEIVRGLLLKAIELDDNLIIAKNLFAATYYQLGEYDNALEIYKKNLKQAQFFNNKSQIATILGSIGGMYALKDEIEKSYKYYKKALIVAEEIEDVSTLIFIYGNLSNYYWKKMNYNRALDYNKLSINLSKKCDKKLTNFFLILNRGGLFLTLRNICLAQKYIKKSLNIAQKLDDKMGISRSLNLMGFSYELSGEYSKVFENQKHAIEIQEKLGYKKFIGEAYNSIGLSFFYNKKYENAIESANKAIFSQASFERKDILLESKTLLFLCYKKINEKYNVEEIHTLIKEAEKIEFELNYRLYELLKDKSYLETAYNQVQEKADNLEPDVAAKFLSYPIPKAIVEEWEKVK